jgi:predicted component of type VI protein secretion system
MNTLHAMSITPGAMTLILFALLSGCASTPAPTAQLAVANAAVQHANTSSTSQDAPAELQIAVAKLASAQQAETNRDYERAIQLAQEAEVDAQVAELTAQSARSRRAAVESQDAAHVLVEEIDRQNHR